MILQIILDGNNIKLVLQGDRKIVGELGWVGEYSLSEDLLSKIEELLRNHNINRDEIEKVTTRISSTSGVTSSRIVETVAKTWNVSKSG